MLGMVYVASILALERQICWLAASQTVALQLPAYAALGNAEVLLREQGGTAMNVFLACCNLAILHNWEEIETSS